MNLECTESCCHSLDVLLQLYQQMERCQTAQQHQTVKDYPKCQWKLLRGLFLKPKQGPRAGGGRKIKTLTPVVSYSQLGFMLYIQSWQYFQSIIHIVYSKIQKRKSSVFPPTRASLVSETNSLESQQLGRGLCLVSLPPPCRDNIQRYIYIYGTDKNAYLLPHATTRVQISCSQTGALHQKRRSFFFDLLALPDCRAVSVMSFPIGLSVVVGAGRTTF